MRKNLLLVIATFILLPTFKLRADEGMWLPLLLKNYNYEDMKKKGLKLTPEQLYDVNNSSLKDAIVWFGGGCTGEVISSKGLVLTNHHCGYDAISELSSAADNILDNGFWAKSYKEERPVPGLTVSFVVRMEDITKEVLDSVGSLNEKDRAKRLPSVFKNITSRITKGTHYEAQCREMFKGNAYYVFVFERFTDIRLVGTPPQNIGKFGGETDNWMWPRHTGDFSMFRIYSGKDGKPAKYTADNIPYTPKHHLPINLKGIKDGDFAMIMGFPGRTNRYEFSQGVQIATDLVDPAIVKLREVRLNAWKEQMNKDVDVRLKLSGDFASIANYWKYFRGEAEQLKKNKVYEQKVKEEKSFSKWAADKNEYKNLLTDVEKAFATYKPYSTLRTYLNEGIQAPTVSKFAAFAISLEEALEKGDDKATKATQTQLLSALEEMPYSVPIIEADKRIFDSILLFYFTDVPKDYQPAYMSEIVAAYNKENMREAIKAYTAHVFANSIFADKEMTKAWIQNPRMALLKNDPAYKHVKAFRDHYNKNYKSKVDEFNENIQALGRTYIKGLIEMNKDKKYYPDANSSLRLTYGSVRSYMKYPLITNLDEVMQKNEKYKGNPEFDVPQRLRDLHKAKNYGPYAMKDGKLPVAFLTNNDITGGNSGSPVIDGEGRITGLAFDGNWEAMSGNIHFDPANKRTICVDIRYVMFLVDKYGEASNIINELTIVR